MGYEDSWTNCDKCTIAVAHTCARNPFFLKYFTKTPRGGITPVATVFSRTGTGSGSSKTQEERSLDCATRRARLRRGGEERPASEGGPYTRRRGRRKARKTQELVFPVRNRDAHTAEDRLVQRPKSGPPPTYAPPA
jgi:hypothetical protein